MEGKVLHKYRECCTELKLNCCKNMNRAVMMMAKKHKHNDLLGKFVELQIVMEKLCDYAMKCCCLTEVVSKHTLMDVRLKCEQMIKLCETLHKHLDEKESKYLRCEEIIGMSKTLHEKSKVQKKKTKKTNL